jgi:hypothetical protein
LTSDLRPLITDCKSFLMAFMISILLTCHHTV